MAFGPGLHVFPGGRVDPEDSVAHPDEPPGRSAADASRILGGNVAPDDALALHRAAIRELREEVGILLAGTDCLAPIAHWTTPVFMPRRFSTWFFVADLPPTSELVFEAEEVADHAWLTPGRALDGLAAREIDMWVPTTSVLERLAETGARTAADVTATLTMARVEPPRIVSESETEVRFAFSAAGALPGRACVTRLVGRRDLVVVDPGDPSEAAIRAIDDTVARRDGAIRAIVLTASDPDHAAGAEALAIPRQAPVLVAPGGGRHLPYDVVELGDGDRLPTDVDTVVRLGEPGSAALKVVSAGE
jgi:8-oxo-dGTP pyrophosphatase MutT (NUDIX family)